MTTISLPVNPDSTPDNPEDAVKRALTYPYGRPTQGFIFHNGNVDPIPPDYKPDKSLTAVLAVGSNAAPEQLLRKFGASVTIPVLAVNVVNADVVYAATLASYGSVPATLIACPGTTVCIFATLLNKEALEIMDRSERGGYNMCRLSPHSGMRLVWRDGIDMNMDDFNILSYVSKFGALLIDQKPIALKEIPAIGRSLRQLSQPRVNQVLIDINEKNDETVEQFVLRNAQDASRRVALVREMTRTGEEYFANFNFVRSLV